MLKNKRYQSDAGGNVLAKLDCPFGIRSPNAIQEIIKSRLLSAQKKVNDIAFYLDQKGETDRQPLSTMDGQ